MKRTLCFILTLLLAASIPLVSFAMDYSCEYHPNASLVSRETVSCVQEYIENSSHHRKVWSKDYYCSICGEWASGIVLLDEYEPHHFVGNTCTDCGYRRDNKLTQEELQAKAIQRINKDGNTIIGKQAIVQHVGNLRYEANKYADSYRAVAEEESFEILSYTFVNGNVWLEVRCGNSSAWISASLVEISGEGAGGTGSEEIDRTYIGMRCRITVSSGRARMGIGTDYPIVEYVGYNDEFTILDIGYANDGTLWFQIRKDGNRCWISSGIATVEGY